MSELLRCVISFSFNKWLQKMNAVRCRGWSDATCYFPIAMATAEKSAVKECKSCGGDSTSGYSNFQSHLRDRTRQLRGPDIMKIKRQGSIRATNSILAQRRRARARQLRCVAQNRGRFVAAMFAASIHWKVNKAKLLSPMATETVVRRD